MLPRIGVVASPAQAELLVPIMQALHFPVTALWCKGAEVCRALAVRLGVPHQPPSFQDLLMHPEVDLVYVATEPGMHAEVAVKALTSGKHCICQKPPSICQAEAEKMVSLSRYYSQLTTILESHLRFLPAVRHMKELIGSGFCGRLLAVEARVLMGSLLEGEAYSWKCEPGAGGGVLSNMGSHIIDLVSFVTGQQAEKVHSCLKTFKPHTEKIHGYRSITSDDFCSFQMQCTEGLVSTVTLNTHAPGKFSFDFAVTGSDGRLVLRGMDLHGCQNREPERLLHRQEPASTQQLTQLPAELPAEFYQPFLVGLREMLQALRHTFESSAFPSPRKHARLPPAATFEDGIYIRTVLDALFESHTTGKWVVIPKTNLVESTNPFWTSSAARVDGDKPSPKAHRPVFV